MSLLYSTISLVLSSAFQFPPLQYLWFSPLSSSSLLYCTVSTVLYGSLLCLLVPSSTISLVLSSSFQFHPLQYLWIFPLPFSFLLYSISLDISSVFQFPPLHYLVYGSFLCLPAPFSTVSMVLCSSLYCFPVHLSFQFWKPITSCYFHFTPLPSSSFPCLSVAILKDSACLCTVYNHACSLSYYL